MGAYMGRALKLARRFYYRALLLSENELLYTYIYMYIVRRVKFAAGFSEHEV